MAISSNMPADNAAAVTASDSTTFSTPTRALYVGTTGDVAVRTKGLATTLTFTAVPAGAILPIRVDRVLSTGTTASNIIRLW